MRVSGQICKWSISRRLWFSELGKCLKMNRKPRNLCKLHQCVGTMASACERWNTRPRGKWEGSIRDEIKIQVLIEKDIAQPNSNRVFFTSSSIPTKIIYLTRCCFSLLTPVLPRVLHCCLLLPWRWPTVLKVVITTSKQIANQWTGEDRRVKGQQRLFIAGGKCDIIFI